MWSGCGELQHAQEVGGRYSMSVVYLIFLAGPGMCGEYAPYTRLGHSMGVCLEVAFFGPNFQHCMHVHGMECLRSNQIPSYPLSPFPPFFPLPLCLLPPPRSPLPPSLAGDDNRHPGSPESRRRGPRHLSPRSQEPSLSGQASGPQQALRSLSDCVTRSSPPPLSNAGLQPCKTLTPL